MSSYLLKKNDTRSFGQNMLNIFLTKTQLYAKSGAVSLNIYILSVF